MNDDEDAVITHMAWCEHRGLRPGTLTKRRWHLQRMGRQLGELQVPCSLLEATPAALREWQTGLTTGPEARAVAHQPCAAVLPLVG